MKRTRNNRKYKKQVFPLSYIIGIFILLAAIIFSVLGMMSNASEKDPAASPSAALTPSPTPTGKETPSPSASSEVTAPVVSGEKPAVSKNPNATPIAETDFTMVTKSHDDIYQGNLILVNNEYPFQFKDFQERVCLYENKTNSYKVSDYDVYVGENTVEPLNAMLSAFYYKKGTDDSYIISGYRSFERQQTLFNNEVAEKGEAEAIHWVAKPGTSEHHTGLAIDFGVLYDNGEYYTYEGTGDFAWINENCYKYGFIVRYKSEKKDITGISYEPWHFRYLGIPHATKINELDICLEEYIEYLRDYSYKKPLLIETDDGSVYETYFCAGLAAYVPKNNSYEISGNNVDGFIVTAKIG